MSMEHDNSSNQNIAAPILCRNGCGFYGNASFENMCSKCYKDVLKRKEQSDTSPSQPSTSSSVVSAGSRPASAATPVSQTVTSLGCNDVRSSGQSVSPTELVCATDLISSSNSLETATTTIPTTSVAKDAASEKSNASLPVSPSSSSESVELNAVDPSDVAAASDSIDKDNDKDKKPKKNRCHTCKKKTGLTGFQCRCGGLFCSLHRYSDKHECTFNYKEMAQEQIRKNNPVVIGSKIQKI